MPKGKSERGLADKRRTLAYKLRIRARRNIARGHPANWASDALDLYLAGTSVADIAGMMDMHGSGVGAAIAKEALFRLMAQRQCDRLDELGLQEGKAGHD